jgi:hypothetical protein
MKNTGILKTDELLRRVVAALIEKAAPRRTSEVNSTASASEVALCRPYAIR